MREESPLEMGRSIRSAHVFRRPRDRVWDVLCDLAQHTIDEIGEAVGPRWIDGMLDLRKAGWPVRRAPDGAFFLESRSPIDMTRRLDAAEEKRLLDGLDRSAESKRSEPPPPMPMPPPSRRVETAGGAFVDDGSGHYTPEDGEPPEFGDPGPMLLSGEGTLDLAPGLSLPPDAVTQTFGVLAKKGAGKSYTAMVMCEEMIKQGYPVVILDPTGAWWGLRTGADGRSAGYPVMILGGEHGDLPLPVSAGKKIARLVVERRFQWLLIDLSKLMPDDQHRFVFDFCGTLYHENRDAIHLFVDEADEFVPQKAADALEHKVFGVMDRIVRRGRIKGIGITLISQRSAVINKNVLSQVEVLVALRTIAPPDLDAIEAWTKRHIGKDERERFMTSLPKLRIGDAWFISPAWLGTFKRVSVRRRITFDSSATPKVGEKRVLPDKVASVDIESVRALLADVEEPFDGDGEHLVAKIAELEAKLRESGASRPKIAKSDLSVIEAGSRKVDEASKRLAKLGEDARAIVAAIQPLLDEIDGASRSLAERADAVSSLADGPELLGPIPAPGESDDEEEDDDAGSVAEEDRKPRRSPTSRAKGDGIPSTPVRILRALASIERPLSSLEIGVLSGVRYAGGTFSTKLGEARDEELVSQNEDDNRYKITLKGVAHLSKLGALPSEPQSGSETLALWKRGRIGLKPRQIEIVELVIAAGDKGAVGMTKVEIAEKLGVVVSGGSFGEYISDLVAAGLLVEKEGRKFAPNPVLLPDLPF